MAAIVDAYRAHRIDQDELVRELTQRTYATPRMDRRDDKDADVRHPEVGTFDEVTAAYLRRAIPLTAYSRIRERVS
ncbi:hypothetical protein ACX3O0_05560 [Homoserinimonas sp. A447]